MLLSSVSAVVTLVLNEPESDVILDAKLEDTLVNDPLTPTAVNVLISEALVPSEPLISLAICAELLTTDPSASPSSDVNLEAKLEDTLVNDPLTPAAVNVLINEAFDPNEPLISLAICAELLTTEPSASPSSDVNLDAKLELTDVNEPLIFVPKAELNTVASKCENEPVEVEEPLILPDTSKLPVITPLPV